MDKRRIQALEKAVKLKTGKNESPPPGFFEWSKGVLQAIEYRESLLKQGYSIEEVYRTPVFFE